MQKILLVGAFASILLAGPAFGQNAVVQYKATATTPGSIPVTPGTPLPVTGTFSASLSGFVPSLGYATLTATAASSASTALPTNTGTVAFQNNTANTVSCTLASGAATALANEILVPAGSTVFMGTTGFDHVACINQTGSASNVIVLAGGSGLGAGFAGSSSGGSSGTVDQGTGGVSPWLVTGVGGTFPVTGTFFQATQPVSITSGAVGAGAFAASALAAGAFATGAGVDGWDLTQGAKADAAWTTGSGSVISLLKAIAASEIVTDRAVNVAQVNGVTTLTGTGAQGTGAQRVTVATDSATVAGSASIPAGTNLVGKVGIDQTTPGTTNGVQVNAALPAGANVIGHVIADTGSTTAVTQATAANLNATVVGTGTFAAQLTGATNNINNIAGTVSLPTGASTSANQTATQAPVAPATATATKAELTGCQATSAAINPTTGQQAAIDCDLNNNLLVSAGGAPNLATAQVSVTTGNITVAGARALRRAITITNVTGTSAIYCGNTGVATTTGTYLGATAGSSITLNTTAAVFCTVASITQTVTVAETY